MKKEGTKINSNTILFDKESKFYSELESLALKIASENQIENVSQVKIAIDEDDAVMQFEGKGQEYFATFNHDDPNSLFISTTPWGEYNTTLVVNQLNLIRWNDESIDLIATGNNLVEMFEEAELINSYFPVELGYDKDFIPTEKQILDLINNSAVDRDSGSALVLIDFRGGVESIIAEGNNVNVVFYEIDSRDI